MTTIDPPRLHAETVALRRELHRVPEVGLHLPVTQRRILAALDGLALELTRGSALTSVTAVLRGPRPGGPCVLLRADMDALPIVEETGLPFASEHDGAMHACGHDAHSAMLVGAARILAARREELAGDVVLMFQPGEEGHQGARIMLEEGVLDAAGARPLAAYALHLDALHLPPGTFATRPGTMLAASQGLEITVRGRGGPAAVPHITRDPWPAVAALLGALYALPGREFDALADPVILSVGSVQGGDAYNVIPDAVTILATARAFSPAADARLRTRIDELCAGVGSAHRVTIEVERTVAYPATVCDPEAVALVAEVVAERFGAPRWHPLPAPQGAAEDFAYILSEIPGAMILLDACPADRRGRPVGHHSPRVVFDEAHLHDGAALLADLAIARLARG